VSSSICTGNLLDPGTKPVVAPAEAELGRPLPQLHVSRDLVDVLPGNPMRTAASNPGRNTTDQTGALTPDPRPAEKRNNLQRLAGVAFQREIVDVPAPPPLGIEKLMVEDAESKVDAAGQFCPTFVRMSNGTAATATIRMTKR
jgi:hypothetical protein